MMLAHEMLHAILQHNLQEYEEALRVEPVWRERPFEQLEDAVDNDSALMHKLAPLNYAQEIEADREGLKLVARAGWAPERAALYFKKAMRASSRPNVDSESHPSPAARWQAARELAARIGQDRSQAAPAGVTMDAKHKGTR
jgi:predicted Zn-dependent protease